MFTVKFDTIDWSQVPPEYNFCHRDRVGRLGFYTHHPIKHAGFPGVCFTPKELKFIPYYKKGNLPWEDSLLERPNKKEGL